LGWRMQPRCGCDSKCQTAWFLIVRRHTFRVSSLSFDLSLYCVKCPLRAQSVGWSDRRTFL